MIENYNGAGLRGPLWTTAGVLIGGLAARLAGGAALAGAYGSPMGGYGTALAVNSEIMAAKDAKIAQLESQIYADGKTRELYAYNVAQDEKTMNYLVGLEKRVSSLETAAPLREQILEGKICEVASNARCGLERVGSSVAALSATVASITKLIVPASAVCPSPMPEFNSWTAPTASTTATT